ncbi:restriction endonuclease subunit S [Kocuria rosea]|uniref:Restriction endonuclease subunit S n=1 Tax=Kocuria rosea TaxID=1275 RepID=A0A4R5YN15_KOCRO|nr:restriction endonuclease subunit S [Kocuria rosea]TDL46489.1 restriction endonuclease subunit S [Kocuria rosea]
MTWKMVPLKEIGTWYGGGTPSKGAPEFWTDGTIPWLSPKDMGQHVLERTKDKVTEAAVSASPIKLVPENSVAMVVRSGILEHTFPSALVPFATSLNQDMKAVVTNADVEPQWLAWGVKAFEREILRTCTKAGTTVASIDTKRLQEFRLPVPSLDEQRRLLAQIEETLSHLEAAKRSVEMALTRIKTFKSATLQKAVPDARDYPAHWEASTVGKAGLVELGRQRHPDWHTGEKMHPYLRVANVFENRIDTRDVKEMHWPEHTFERFRLHPGDILLNEGQSPDFLGRPAMYTGTPKSVAFTNSLLRFKAHEGVLPEFALLVFRRHMHAGRFKREARITTNIAHLSATRLKPIEFPIPPLNEQQRIVTETHDELERIQRLETAFKAQYRRADSLRRSVLTAAFEGRLMARCPPSAAAPNTQSPDDLTLIPEASLI